MIDEGDLKRLLEQFGDSFEVPEVAQAAIIEASAPGHDTHGQRSTIAVRSFVPSARKKKGLLAAAALAVLLAGGITFAAEQSNQASEQNASNAPSAIGSGANSHGASGLSATQGQAPESQKSVRTGSTGAGPAGSGSAGHVPSSSPKTTANPQVPPSSGQAAKVVANGTVDLAVKAGSLQSVLADLTELAASEGGFVANTQAQYGQTSPPSPPSGTIVLRVPESSFGTAVTQVQRYGKATSVNTTSNDVTGQYVNLQARISAAQASLSQYLTILRQATTIPNILTVQDQINSIQSNIDQMQGQLNVLNNETTYGTLTVSITEPAAKAKAKPKAKPRPTPSGVTTAWHDGVGGFVSGFEWFIRILGPVLITGLIIAGLFILVTRAWRFARRRTI
jgi:Domain of unknown function (DUF4349)